MSTFNNHIELILEKDHRQKMIKFGIPPDVADFLHSLDSKYSLWFANELKKMPGFQNADNKINWIQARVLTPIQGILDWVKRVPNILLKQYNWETANKAQKEWHDSLETQKLEKLETNKILKRYDTGFYWVDLETNRCSDEAKLMGHCASTNADTLWSLRKYTESTNSIESFITMGVSPDEKTWTQCKGKKNSKPKKEYWSYIADILISNKILQFKSEYDASNDFTSHDLVKYIEDNTDMFPNWETLVDDIKKTQISFEDFEKILEEEKCKDMQYFSIWLDSDNDSEEEYVRCIISFYFEIPLDKFGEYSYNVQRYVERSSEYGGEDSPLSKKFINSIPSKVFSYSCSWQRFYVNDKRTQLFFQCDIEDDDNYLGLTDEGLKTFRKRICENYKWEDSRIDEDELWKAVLQFFIDEGIVPPLDDPNAHSIIKPIKPEDPRQLKFPFMNESKMRFKQFVNL